MRVITLIRWGLETAVQLLCLVGLMWVWDVPSGIGFWRMISAGIPLSLLVWIERSQERRKKANGEE